MRETRRGRGIEGDRDGEGDRDNVERGTARERERGMIERDGEPAWQQEGDFYERESQRREESNE